MITYPITLPTVGISAVKFRQRSVVAVSRSPFTFQHQNQVSAGQAWLVDVLVRPMQRVDAEEWIAALLSLNGKQGTFLLGDPAGTSPRGSGAGSPVVNGGSQIGQLLSTSGWTPSAQGVLLRGDWIQLGGTGSPATPKRIYRVLKDVNADASGLASVDIWPRIRESPLNGSAVVLSNTKGTFMLDSNDLPWEIEPGPIYSIEFGAVEDLRT
jgi:hypothetical protein